jgi:hypothetical protein
MAGDVAFYVGTPPKAYVDARPAMVEINATYKPLAYARGRGRGRAGLGRCCHRNVAGQGCGIDRRR